MAKNNELHQTQDFCSIKNNMDKAREWKSTFNIWIIKYTWDS